MLSNHPPRIRASDRHYFFYRPSFVADRAVLHALFRERFGDFTTIAGHRLESVVSMRFWAHPVDRWGMEDSSIFLGIEDLTFIGCTFYRSRWLRYHDNDRHYLTASQYSRLWKASGLSMTSRLLLPLKYQISLLSQSFEEEDKLIGTRLMVESFTTNRIRLLEDYLAYVGS